MPSPTWLAVDETCQLVAVAVVPPRLDQPPPFAVAPTEGVDCSAVEVAAATWRAEALPSRRTSSVHSVVLPLPGAPRRATCRRVADGGSGT